MTTPLTICFTTPKHWTFVSWLIKRFTKSHVSHAAIGTDVAGVPVLLHCTAKGVVITNRARYERADEIIEEYLVPAVLQESLPHAVEHVGDKYDFVALLGFAWLLTLKRWFRAKVKNPLASSRAMVCSEFVLHLDHDGKIKEWAGLDPERTTAEDLRVICQKSRRFRRIG